MFNALKIRLKEAAGIRKHAELPSTLWLVITLVVFTILFCVLSVYAVPSDKPAEFNFQEGGAVTALSAIYLALGCGFAVASNLIHFRTKGSNQLLWIIIAAGLAFLAFDELLQFHERIGRMVIDKIIPRIFFRNWNDAIVVMYGVVALPMMLFLLPSLLRYRLVLELFALAFFFYAVHTIIDSTQEPATLMSNVFEESAKVISTAFLALGAFAGFLGNLWSQADEHEGGRTNSNIQVPANQA